MAQQNLVAGTLSDTNKQAVLATIDTIRQKLPFLVTLTDDERRSLPKMGDKSTAYVQKSYEFAQQKRISSAQTLGWPTTHRMWNWKRNCGRSRRP